MPPMELDELREIAARAVRAGMDVVRSRRGERNDLTSMEHAAEAAAIDVLRGGDPNTPVVGEMSGGEARGERVWVVDPVDGIANLVRGDPFVAVTVALLVEGRPVIGATGCPFTGELRSAAQGAGAHDSSGRRLELVERPAGGRRIALDPTESDAGHLATWNEARARLTQAFGEVELRSAIALELATSPREPSTGSCRSADLGCRTSRPASC
jgi:fructose-1,6-bisphosphatase/inositol monophosphatase family enzyme